MFVRKVGPLRFGGGRKGLYARDFRLSLKKAPPYQSLKVVIPKCAFKLSFSQTALLETYVLSCTDTGHSYQAFQSTLFHHGPLLGRA